MVKSSFHISPTVPGAMDALRWDSHGRTIKDLVLNSELVDQYGIAAMTIHLSSMSAIGQNDEEHFIRDFKEQGELKLNGIVSGKSIRTRSIVKLSPGYYKGLRLYTSGKISYMSQNREYGGIYGLDFIDFDFDSLLEIRGNESPEFMLRFNFLPIQSKQLFERFKYMKYFSRIKPKEAL